MVIECTEKQLDVMNTILESIGMQKLSKDYMSYDEWVEMMGGAANVELRELIFSKRLSM